MRVVAILILAVLSARCGTILHGPTEAIFVDSRPPGATTSILCTGDIRISGTTPVKLEIPRRAEGCNLTVARDGYRTRTVELEQGFSPWFWANFATGPVLFMAVQTSKGGDLSYEAMAAILSGGVGFLVDHLTRAKYDHDPKEIVVDLERAP